MGKHRTSIIIVMLVATSVAGNRVGAVPIAYDGFDYPIGNLHGQNGGTGWASPWGTVVSNLTVESPGLTHPGLASTGNRANVQGAAFRTINVTSAAANGVPMTGAFIGAPSTSVWISVVAQVPNPNLSQFNVVVFQQGAGSPGGSGERAFIGVPFSNFSGGTTYWGVGYGVGGGANSSTVSASLQRLLVGRVDFSATGIGGTVRLWLNPTIGATPPSDASAVAVLATPGGFGRSLYFDRMELSSNSTFLVDELRIGTTWADVVPVPEPHTVAWLGLGAACLLARRRRRR